MQIQGQPVPYPRQHPVWRGRGSQWQQDLSATWGQQSTRAGDEEFSSSLQWAPFCSLGLEPAPAHCQPQQRPGQKYKASEIVGSGGEGLFSTLPGPLAGWLYACKLPCSRVTKYQRPRRGLRGKKGFLGIGGNVMAMGIHHTCKNVSQFKVFVRGRAHGCGTGPGLLST